MVSKADQAAGRCLHLLLAPLADGDEIPDSDDFQELQLALEFYLPAVLRGVYPAYWEDESFDGFRFTTARRTGSTQVELLGLGLLISDQTWTPVHVRLRAAADQDRIAWVSCQVGDRDAARKGMARIPYGSSQADKLAASVRDRPEEIEWEFSVVHEALERAV